MTRRTPLRRGGRLRSVSLRRQRGRAAWAKVYLDVDRRSGGRCELVWAGIRCHRQATEHHHTLKPRSSFNTPDAVIHVCGGPKGHHRQVDAPFSQGRLVIVPLGGGRFHSCITTAVDKFAARAQEAM